MGTAAMAYPDAGGSFFRRPVLAGLAVCLCLYALRAATRSEPFAVTGSGDAHVGRGAKLYGCMMDAGSTGSRIHVYRFAQRADGSLKLEDEVFEQLKPGVSSFAATPKAAAESLAPLLDAAMGAVPAEQHATTPIALYATAGLRLLPGGQADAILAELRAALAATPFLFDPKNVGITEGKLEGVFAWTTVNFLLGNLDKGARRGTAGIIDLGGGSTQIVFEPSGGAGVMGNVKRADTHAMLMGGSPHELFAHSYLGYGLNSAAATLRKLPPGQPHPCYPAGSVTHFPKGVPGHPPERDVRGSGDAAACKAHITAKIHALEADGMKLVAQPPTSGVPFYIFSYFFDRLVEGAGMPANSPITLDEIEGVAVTICGLSVEDVAAKYPKVETPEQLCLDVSFCGTLLREGYGVPQCPLNTRVPPEPEPDELACG